MKLFLGGSRAQRAAAVRGAHPATAAAPPLREIHAAAQWPFLRHVLPPIQPPVFGGGATLWLRDLHLAFPQPKTPGLRMVLTQSTYQLQRVLDAVDANPSYAVVADADERIRSEIAGRRGPWVRIEITDLGGGAPEGPPYLSPDALTDVPSSAAALLLHQATAQLQAQDSNGALATIEEAIRLDPSWEASHFELGKICLRLEQTGRAAAAFAEASRLMPSFAAAASNLGAALGEMDRSDEALDALELALRHDPNGFPILNNIGAVHREAGRLDQAEAAFRRVIELAPSFAFGHYNLGHTLFLQGRFGEARTSYEEGHTQDPQKNARQACRLAVARAAAGDPAGAIDLIEGIGASVPEEAMRGMAEEAEQALLAAEAVENGREGPTASAYPAVLAVVRRYTA
jgi:tetratricopeptide (TPR) repeat protein